MKRQTIKVMAVGAATILSLQAGGIAMAWGPERPTYTNEKPADHAVFNSITNNVAVGDERDFVRIVEKGTGNKYRSEIEVEAEKEYEVYIYYHNDASSTYNDAAHNYVGIAQNVRLSTGFPEKLSAGERGVVNAKITSTNTDPKSVWDEAYITAKEDITLHYVLASAKIYNQWGVNGSVLPMSIFSDQGTFLGLDELDGLILGCSEYSGQVVYTIQTHAVDNPNPDPEPEPEPDPTPDPDPDPVPPTPELPEELPTTGPAEVVLAIVVVLAVAAGVVYWYRTNKAVKKTTRKVKGRK